MVISNLCKSNKHRDNHNNARVSWSKFRRRFKLNAESLIRVQIDLLDLSTINSYILPSLHTLSVQCTFDPCCSPNLCVYTNTFATHRNFNLAFWDTLPNVQFLCLLHIALHTSQDTALSPFSSVRPHSSDHPPNIFVRRGISLGSQNSSQKSRV